MDEIKELNSQLGLWKFFPKAGKHLPFWAPTGAFIRSAIEEFWKSEHYKHGYQLVYTPHIANIDIWEKTGHLERYADSMYPPIGMDDEEYILRPMNCPFHMLLFSSKIRSYKEMPIRYAELGTVYRKISSGSFKEMFEVRGFTQDDAHIFIESDKQKIKEEIANLLQFTIYFLRDVFKINDFKIIRRLRPPEAIGEDFLWDMSQTILSEVLEEKELDFQSIPGEGIFYGPKIDFELRDHHYKKPWICSTIQLDIVLPRKFDLLYTTEKNEKDTPILIHRTILGSLERFIGIIISRTKGHLPLWLSQCQIFIVPVDGSEYNSNFHYANTVKSILEDKLEEFQPRISISSEKIRLAEAKKTAIINKIPFIIVVGGKERMNQIISVTSWTGENYSDPQEIEIRKLAEIYINMIKSKT